MLAFSTMQPPPADERVVVVPTAPTATAPATTAPATAPVPPTSTLAPTAPPAAVATATATPTATPIPTVAALLPGDVQTADDWLVTLLRPDYVRILQVNDNPGEQLLLVLPAVQNNAPSERTLPADLVRLRDSLGRQYLPEPGASTQFLQQQGQGVAGDIALETPFAPTSGLLTLPLIFRPAPDAADLVLIVGDDDSAGWAVVPDPALTIPCPAPCFTTP